MNFDKFQKHGPICLQIKDGDMKVSCENANVFTNRVTLVIKHHANISYYRWNDMPDIEQEELCSRIRANQRMTVTNQLRKRFNAFHYELHKLYLGYKSHKAALAGGTSLVDEATWRTLCMHWGSTEFKLFSSQNKANRRLQHTNHTAGRTTFVRLLEEKQEHVTNPVEFFKESRWS